MKNEIVGFDIRRNGLIELRDEGGRLVSVHTVMEEAMESLTADATSNSAIESYFLTYPPRTVRVLRRPVYLPFDTTPPQVPQGFEVVSQTAHTAVIGWDASTDVDFAQYVADYSTDQITWTNAVTGTATTFNLTGLRPSILYYLRVKAVDHSGNHSSYSQITHRPATPTVSAVVTLYNAANQPTGVGPSRSPNGVFFGRTDLASGDTWNSLAPAGVTITEYAGGDFSASGPSGTYQLPWDLYDASTQTYITGTKTFTMS